MPVPDPLIDEIAEGRCLPFIGAGFSLNASLPPGLHMPDWKGLTAQLAAAAGVPTGDGPSIAALYERRFGRVGLIDAIRRSLHPDAAEPGAAHRALANLPFDTIYTTNFDLLLERAWQINGRPHRSLVGELQMPFHGGRVTTSIVKMHGDIGHEEHIISTARDYAEFGDRYPVIATHLSAMLITRTGLFIGYSRIDPDFIQINEVVKSRLGRFQRMSYLIEFNATDEEIERALDEQIHIINVSLAPGQSHDEALAELFNEVQKKLDVDAGTALRRTAPDIFEPLDEVTLKRTYASKDAGRLFESSTTLCFVLMPFRLAMRLPFVRSLPQLLSRPALWRCGRTIYTPQV